jgi:hypothetical protein
MNVESHSSPQLSGPSSIFKLLTFEKFMVERKQGGARHIDQQPSNWIRKMLPSVSLKLGRSTAVLLLRGTCLILSKAN